jgi:hypothetical protein
MARERTVSRHMLRRTAREKQADLEHAQQVLQQGGMATTIREFHSAQALLSKAKIGPRTPLTVRSSIRGPYGWKVVAR